MSVNATIEGRLTFADRAAFDAAVALLREGGWINTDGLFVDEGGDVVPPGAGLDVAAQAIVDPLRDLSQFDSGHRAQRPAVRGRRGSAGLDLHRQRGRCGGLRNAARRHRPR